jgi:formylglycine-generating enzyme required for sulfatase activity
VRQALHDKDEQIAGTARTILAKWGETPVEKKLETLKVTIKGKIQQMPARLFNAVELNAEYILIPGAKEKFIFESTKKPAPDYPLYFAKYPVTNKLYNRFLSYLAGENKEALPLEQFAAGLLQQAKTVEGFAEFLGEDLKAWKNKLDSYHDKRFNGDDQPAVTISWFAATAYCHWLTELHKSEAKSKNQTQSYIFRLPIEEEWEWAASGSTELAEVGGKREYPWGNKEPDETRANYGQKVGHTTPVGAYAKGATPEGLMDMAGNVWEWCENLYRENEVWCSLRGGSWYNDAGALGCAVRYDDHPLRRFDLGGFRVVVAQS